MRENTLKLTLRKFGTFTDVEWNPKETAIILCDMWNQHWCNGATKRVAEMAPRLNELISALRDMGATVIHAPSDTVSAYRDHPGFKAINETPEIPLERFDEDIPPQPIDSSDEGCDCTPSCPHGNPWRHQIDTLVIDEKDLIGDNSKVVMYLKTNGFKNVIIAGVHTNMCILHRGFAIKNLKANGFSPVLVRDLTDAMYNHKMPPYVDHFVGVELIIDYIERYLAHTVTSDQILGGKPFRFSEDKR